MGAVIIRIGPWGILYDGSKQGTSKIVLVSI